METEISKLKAENEKIKKPISAVSFFVNKRRLVTNKNIITEVQVRSWVLHT